MTVTGKWFHPLSLVSPVVVGFTRRRRRRDGACTVSTIREINAIRETNRITIRPRQPVEIRNGGPTNAIDFQQFQIRYDEICPRKKRPICMADPVPRPYHPRCCGIEPHCPIY